MCFSASASFIASGGLAALGGASLVTAKKEDKILALIPLLFAAQQLFEGIQWLYLAKGSSSLFAGYGFLFFAFVLWPIYVPSAVFALDRKRRALLSAFIFIGAAVAAYFISLVPTHSLSIHRFPSCITYSFDFPFGGIVTALYMVAIFGPLLVSSRRVFRCYGAAIMVLAAISWRFYAVAFTSVWCFFAAVVSSMFFVYLNYRK
jgi:hypothetical protein